MALDNHPMVRIWNNQFEPGRNQGNVERLRPEVRIIQIIRKNVVSDR